MVSLTYLSQQITLYIGIFLFIAGLVGNGINIWVFGSKKNYRTTPSTFYFLIGSVANILTIMSGLLNRILSTGFALNLTVLSDAWCKSRIFIVIFTTCLSLTCSCLAVIDQFFITSRNNSLRGFSKIKFSYGIMIITTIFWLAYASPFAFYYYITGIPKSCTVTNSVMSIYVTVYTLSCVFAVPISIMTLFGWLTYRNIQQTVALANQNVDGQLLKMALFQVGLVIVSYLPYGIYYLYALITKYFNKDSDQKATEAFISAILSLPPYLFNTISCYIFIFTSRRFRRAVKTRLFCLKQEQQSTVVPR